MSDPLTPNLTAVFRRRINGEMLGCFHKVNIESNAYARSPLHSHLNVAAGFLLLFFGLIYSFLSIHLSFVKIYFSFSIDIKDMLDQKIPNFVSLLYVVTMKIIRYIIDIYHHKNCTLAPLV